jgi:hypothetical protein
LRVIICLSVRPCSPAMHLLHLEVTHLLLVMTSTQLYTPTAAAFPGAHPFTESILEQRDLVRWGALNWGRLGR